MLLEDGPIGQALSYGHGGRAQINDFESVVVSNTLVITADKLAGALTVPPTKEPATYVWQFNGVVAGDKVAGEFTKTVGGKTYKLYYTDATALSQRCRFYRLAVLDKTSPRRRWLALCRWFGSIPPACGCMRQRSS